MSSECEANWAKSNFRFGIIGIVFIYHLIFNLWAHNLRAWCRGYYDFSCTNNCRYLFISIFYAVYRFPQAFLGYGLVGILWALTFPLYSIGPMWSHYTSMNLLMILFGLLIFMGLSGIQFLLNQTNRFHKTTSLIMAITPPWFWAITILTDLAITWLLGIA